MCRQSMMIPIQSTTMEYRDIKLDEKHKKTERGSITLEAAIFLTLFILFYVAMMDLIQIAKAQVVLQYSINEAAKNVSVYSYVLTKAGLTGKRQETSGEAADIKEIITQIESVSSALANRETYNSIDETSDMLSLLKTEVTNRIDDAILDKIVKAEVEKQIDMMSTKGANRFLRDLGIEEGLNGLSFEGSSWADASDSVDGLPVLIVQVTYTIDFHLGYLELQPRTYTLRAKTAIW